MSARDYEATGFYDREGQRGRYQSAGAGATTAPIAATTRPSAGARWTTAATTGTIAIAGGTLWEDEERASAVSGYGGDPKRDRGDRDDDRGRTDRNRSFSSTY